MTKLLKPTNLLVYLSIYLHVVYHACWSTVETWWQCIKKRDMNHCSSILHFFINNRLDGHTVKRYTDTSLVTRSAIQLQIEITNNHTIQIDNSVFPVQNLTALCVCTHTHTNTFMKESLNFFKANNLWGHIHSETHTQNLMIQNRS